jgi:hypothetical protein
MKYKINHAELKRLMLSSGNHYLDMVNALVEQFLEIRQPWTTVGTVKGGTLTEEGRKFLLDAKILEEDKEVAVNG